MHSLVSKAVDVLREEGATSLAGQATRYGYNQGLAWLASGYWRLRGVRPVTVEDVTARYEVGSLHESRELEFLVDNEVAVASDLVRSLDGDDVFFDVGAHVGFYSCLAGRHGAAVVPFEPYPPNVERLRANLRLNGLAATVREVALSDDDGTVTFDQPDIETPGWSRAAISTSETGDLAVPSGTGDSLVADGDLPAPTVVKIDVEGAEGRVIEGMAETLGRAECRLVYCEVHRPREHRQSVRDYGHSASEVETMLADLGFDVEPIHDRTAEVTLRGRK